LHASLLARRFDGYALGGMAGEGVSVPKVVRREICAAHLDGCAAVGGDSQRPFLTVDDDAESV
jgi:hypothetical protein